MENIEIIISLAAAVAGLIGALIGCAVKVFRSVKGKIKAHGELDLLDELMSLVEIAEEFTGYSGEEKRDYVLKKADNFARESGIEIDLALAGDRIEQLIDLTKNVNKRN